MTKLPFNVIVDALQTGDGVSEVVLHHEVVGGEAGQRVQGRRALAAIAAAAHCNVIVFTPSRLYTYKLVISEKMLITIIY